jgi:hypothetical protein
VNQSGCDVKSYEAQKPQDKQHNRKH